jgi:hypothetical protein
MTDPQYVIVHHSSRRNASNPIEVYDCRPDDSLDDIQERAAQLTENANKWGRPGDTYRVAELHYLDDKEAS